MGGRIRNLSVTDACQMGEQIKACIANTKEAGGLDDAWKNQLGDLAFDYDLAVDPLLRNHLGRAIGRLLGPSRLFWVPN